MKNASLAVAILLFCGVTKAQTLAQPSVSHDCGSSTSCSASLANPVVLGNTLLAVIRVGTTNVAATKVSDNLGRTYALDASAVQSIDGHSLAVYRAQNATGGTATVSVSNSSASTMRIIGFAEVAGLISGAPDGVNKSIGSGNLPQAGALLPTQANDYILLAASTANNQTFTANAGFRREQDVTKGAFSDEDQATVASVNGSMSISSADQWAAVAVAYKTVTRLPISFQLNYSDGTPVQGSVQLSVVSGSTTTAVASWPISSSGSVTVYLPLANSGTYSYTAMDPSGKPLQAITVLPGAFVTLAGLHSIQGTVTFNKSTYALMIPASFSMQ